MKVLYVGHYREASAWSRSFCDNAKAMSRVGLDVVTRPIKLGLPSPQLDDEILAMENKSTAGCDVIFSNVLPHHLSYSGHFKKNICSYFIESRTFDFSGWQHYINMCDEAITFCDDSKFASLNSGVNIPISVVPQAVDTKYYQEPRSVIDFGNSDFKFLFVGDISQRKNLPALLRAFHSEFDPSEPVSLVLKVGAAGHSSQEILKFITDMTEKVKKDLRMYPTTQYYKPEIVIADYIDNEQMKDLYHSVDSVVVTSAGEGWSYPIMDCIGFGKYPISSNCGGAKTMINNMQYGRRVRTRSNPCTGEHMTFNGLFTAHSNWDVIDIQDLKYELRWVYENMQDSNFKNSLKANNDTLIEQFSYERVGSQLLDILVK